MLVVSLKMIDMETNARCYYESSLLFKTRSKATHTFPLLFLFCRIAGPLTGPSVTGTARVNKGLIACPFLKFPLRNVTGVAECRDGVLRFDGLEARSGRSGTIR